MKFIITVDTEPDIQERISDPVSLRNLDSLGRFQGLCEKYNFKVTYLVTHEVVDEDNVASLLKSWQNDGKIEVGTHLHPWTAPPASESDDHQAFPTELSLEDLESKFTMLHNKIKDFFGQSPTSYRAGRWGFDDRQAKLIAEFGYLADCSVTPGVNWQRMGGPDFRKEKVFPHRLSSGVLEAPMTILYTGFLKKQTSLLGRLFSSIPDGFIKKIINKLLFRQKWLRVFPNSTKKDWHNIFESAQVNNLPYIMFMVHSNELHLGTSRDTRTQEMLDYNYKNLEEMFSFFSTQGVESITLSDYARVNTDQL